MSIKIANEKKLIQENDLSIFFIDSNKKVEFKEKALEALKEEFEPTCCNIELNKVYTEDKFLNVMFVGLGNDENLSMDEIRNIGGDISRKLKKMKSKKVSFLNIEEYLNKDHVKALVEGLELGAYDFNKYITSNETDKEIIINLGLNENFIESINEGELLAQMTLVSRSLVNEPANVIYPATLAYEVIELGKTFGFETEIYGKQDIENLGMDAFLSVSKGSDKEPKLIVMRYFGDKNSEDVLGLVGKGLTYDSGGYSIKPTNSMVDMKTDMGGAGAVIGAMCGIAKAKLNKNVIAVVAACENLISGNAYKPGDIINSMGKKTIEILNTDAEGRLTLIDAVYYAINKEKVNKVVDIATLTGAAVVALGDVATPVLTNNEEFYTLLYEAAKTSGEKIWRMPVFDEYKKVLKGKQADLNNSPGRDGGCITAGLFIGEFVGDTPWIHMDIAGTSVSSKDSGYKSKGATGEGARTLYNLAKLV
ncbi:aminopeptidase A [Paraclostridium benzoelyticum]|uniref:Probable cytosol aminopeptidase n=1 Tax=Paraclostridium benzoelyticum TaxID=1629550 RepID=A0A0M3DLK2_9FIRM|nr:leucyl aminopeptidase [Paraclostridium benzoelyticum]KKY02324.1 aminopeptidase A [Paraclostridium benzoelyticum]